MTKFKAERSKRYYLHSRVKDICRLDSTHRVIRATEDEAKELESNKYVRQLVNQYGYSIQLIIN